MQVARQEMYEIARDLDRAIQNPDLSIHDLRLRCNDCSTKLKALAARRDWLVPEKDFLD